jgi:hypothetical protein
VRRSLLVCLLSSLGAACGGGLLGREDAGARDGGADASASACPVANSWRLLRIACGAQDITADYVARIPSTILNVTATTTGCSAVLTHRSEFCAEEEAFDAEVKATSWNVSSHGVSMCSLEGCIFGIDDAPCEIGDRAGRFSENLSYGATTFTTARFGSGTFCPASVAQIITWIKI